MSLFLPAALFAFAVIGQAAPPPPASDALVERFMAAIPAPGNDPDPQDLAHFAALNPGRSAEIVPILQDFARCRNAYGVNVMRRIAAALGGARLSRLIAFYEGEDFLIFNRVMAQPEDQRLAQDRAESDRIFASYPLEDFIAAMQPSNPAFSPDEAIAMVERCAQERDAALEQRGLRAS